MVANVVEDPLELVEREYLPRIRALAAFVLKERGVSQSKIAAALGVTQPSVALYMTRRPKEYLARLGDMGVPQKLAVAEAERYVALATAEGAGPAGAALEVGMEALGSGSLCGYHRSTSGLPESCDVCLRLYRRSAGVGRTALIGELADAIHLLESSKTFALLVPEVLTNFVSALPDAKGVDDVAGVAGRIAVVKGRPKAASSPEFGASTYTAGIVLAVRERFPSVSSGLNVKYDPLLDDVVEGLGWRKLALEVRRSSGWMKALAGLVASSAAALGGAPDVLVEKGGVGLEPSAYVLGTSPGEVAEKSLALSATYAKRMRIA